MKCEVWECEGKAEYCRNHYQKIRKKLSNRNYALLILILGLLIWYQSKTFEFVIYGIFLSFLFFYVIKELLDEK